MDLEPAMSNQFSSEVLNPAVSQDFAQALQAAQRGDAEAFGQLTEPYRVELRAHCYRMMGSVEDAEDLVQETFLRAWRRLETYQGRSTLRAWLYKIATNACLDALEQLPRRILTIDEEDSRATYESEQAAGREPSWIEPFPDAWLTSGSSLGPEAQYDLYESVSLAFLVALQILTPRQRVVLLLADVLDWKISEIAELLEISLSATTSLLHRARETMKQRNLSGKMRQSQIGIPDDQTRLLLDQYARAWEAADLNGIIALLADDAIFPMPPMPTAVVGKQAMLALYTGSILAGDARGRWKLIPIRANGLPGFAFYRLDEVTRQYQAFALQLLTIQEGLVVNATTFGFPALFPYFDLPTSL